jgi:hypothetical protein
MGSTQPHYGGRRWWFLCPAIEAGCTCERRVQKLYQPPGTKFWKKDSFRYFLAAEILSHTRPPSSSLPQCRATTLPVINRVALEQTGPSSVKWTKFTGSIASSRARQKAHSSRCSSIGMTQDTTVTAADILRAAAFLFH